MIVNRKASMRIRIIALVVLLIVVADSSGRPNRNRRTGYLGREPATIGENRHGSQRRLRNAFSGKYLAL
jgi:hypothetical protein